MDIVTIIAINSIINNNMRNNVNHKRNNEILISNELKSIRAICKIFSQRFFICENSTYYII